MFFFEPMRSEFLNGLQIGSHAFPYGKCQLPVWQVKLTQLVGPWRNHIFSWRSVVWLKLKDVHLENACLNDDLHLERFVDLESFANYWLLLHAKSQKTSVLICNSSFGMGTICFRCSCWFALLGCKKATWNHHVYMAYRRCGLKVNEAANRGAGSFKWQTQKRG